MGDPSDALCEFDVVVEVCGALLGIGPLGVQRSGVLPHRGAQGEPRLWSASLMILRPELLLRVPSRFPIPIAKCSQGFGIEGTDHRVDDSSRPREVPPV